MSDTPRTDAVTWETIAGAFKCTGANGDLEGKGEYVKSDFARQLERELNALRRKVVVAEVVATSLEAVLRQTSNIEVLGEWSALEMNRSMQKTTRSKIDTIIAKAEDALNAWQEANK